MNWNSITGWRSTIRQGKGLALVMMLAVSMAEAAPRSQETDPPLDMLEFLGSWQTRDGQHVNPFELDDEAGGLPASEREGYGTQQGEPSRQDEQRDPQGRTRSRTPRDSQDQSERPMR